MRYHKRCWLIQTAGRWPWKSESAKECVTTHLPNQLALKMDGAGASGLYRTVAAVVPAVLRSARHAATSRQVAAVARKAGARARLEPPRVQILVVVANIQTRTLKTEVEKGSM